jgi:leucyl-tRNA synthetase
MAEEMWSSIGKKSLVSVEQIQTPAASEAASIEEAKERLVEGVIADVSEILKVTEIKPKRVVVMTAPTWKHQMLADAVGSGGQKVEVPALIKAAMAKVPPDAKKDVPAYAKDLAAELSKASEDDRRSMSLVVDELETLSRARDFLSKEFGSEVAVFSADDPSRTDPKGKARFARPRRPALYVE